MLEVGTFREQLDILAFENECRKQEQVDIPVTHTFSGGVYIRQIVIPKGVLIIGKRHRYETCNMILSGKIAMYVGPSEPPLIMDGAFQFTSGPNVKKILYCMEDAVFATIHPTKETNVAKIEQEFIIPEKEYITGGEVRGMECLS